MFGNIIVERFHKIFARNKLNWKTIVFLLCEKDKLKKIHC